jgi:hypothetical protein
MRLITYATHAPMWCDFRVMRYTHGVDWPPSHPLNIQDYNAQYGKYAVDFQAKHILMTLS